MRRYARTVAFIVVLVTLAGLILGFQSISIGGFERGGDTLLGLKLGLDLQGGSHLVYQAAIEDPVSGELVPPTDVQMASLKTIIERRVNSSGLGEPIIQQLGADRLLIQLPGVDDPGRAKAFIGETARLEFKHRILNVPRDIDAISGEDILSVTIGTVPRETPEEPGIETGAGEEESGTQVIPETGSETEVIPEAEVEPTTEGSEEQVATGEESSQGPEAEGEGEGVEPGSEEPEAAEGPPFLIVEFTESAADEFRLVLDRLNESLLPVPGTTDTYPSSLSVAVQGTETRTFDLLAPFIQHIDGGDSFALALVSSTFQPLAPDVESAREILGDDLTVTFREIQGKVDQDIGLTGDDLARAYPGQHRGSGRPIVNIEFKSEGARKFGELTAEIVNTPEQIAIFLDEEELIAPVVSSVITGGAAFIQGRDFSVERVRDIALLLESGRLPIPIELVQERDVDAILGADSLAKSVVAGLVGLALVFLFMALYYRIPGLVAAVALLIYAAFVLAIFKIIPVTLTLSGVAAAILSIGMAVDANVLIFERMKDELRAGRTLLSAINLGFGRAWPAIRDGNVSTLLTCLVLYYFGDTLGATVVKGFAATLAIGVAVSMFSAITLTRTFLRLLVTTPVGRRLDLFVPAGSAELPQIQPSIAATERG